MPSYDEKDESESYINASYINGILPSEKKVFIAT